MNRRRFLQLSAGAALLPSVPRPAIAQAYPSRQIRIIVGFTAGGNFDIVARLIGQWLSERLGQPVIVENRPGAGSNIATEAVVRATADGYTLLLGGAVNAVNATLYDKLAFNFVDDITPVTGVVRFPNVMTVNPSFPAATIADFIAYAKANPGKINHGSSGNGTTQHLAGELFKMMTGVSFVHVPYRGAPQALTDLIGGRRCRCCSNPSRRRVDGTACVRRRIRRPRSSGSSTAWSTRALPIPGSRRASPTSAPRRSAARPPNSAS